MKMVVAVEVEVTIDEDRANANEVFHAVSKAGEKASERLACSIVEAYQERIVELLCSRSGSVAKKGLGGHERKDLPGRRCRCRTFRRAGYWSDTRTLRGSCGTVTFRPAMVECACCGKRLTPVLSALELEPYEGRTEELVRKVMGAVAETSYRRGSGSLERIAAAEKELEELRRDCDAKGYRRAATYLANTRNRVFNHLWLWLETGLVAPRTASIVENTIRELVRRLKKVGWNWSDAGATRMGRVVMLRRYDEEAWDKYWRDRLNLQGRCKISITQWVVKRVA